MYSYTYVCRGSSRNFILEGGGGGKLIDDVAIRPWRGEGRLHNYNYWQYLGGEVNWVSLGGGGELLLCPPP